MSQSARNPATKAGLASEVAARRTFGIISHPDAGKTTLTEKLLLYGGAIQLAGAVKAAVAAARARMARVIITVLRLIISHSPHFHPVRLDVVERTNTEAMF